MWFKWHKSIAINHLVSIASVFWILVQVRFIDQGLNSQLPDHGQYIHIPETLVLTTEPSKREGGGREITLKMIAIITVYIPEL